MARTSNERLVDIKDLYRESGATWPASAREMAAWGISTGHLDTRPEAVLGYYSDRMAQALREEYFTDERGKRVRAMHAAQTAQGVLWDDIRGEPSPRREQHFTISFQARRKQMVQDAVQLKIDVDYFNRIHKPGRPFQLWLDFTDDVAEHEALEEADAAA
jgi:hypothetical protein